MEFSIATLLSQLSESKLVAPKVLEKKLECQDEESLQKLHIALDALERTGTIAKERGKYRRVPQPDAIEAKLRCSSKGFCFAIPEHDESADDIYIRESQLGSAWNGDRALVKVVKEATRRRSPEGSVQLVLERANPSLLAWIQRSESGFRAVPLDDRLLFELELEAGDVDLEASLEHLAHVEVLRYPLGQTPPLGRVTRVLGDSPESAADADLVCCKYNLPRQFPSAVAEAAQSLSEGLDRAEIKKRKDLRQQLTLALEEAPRSAETPFIENAFTLETAPTGDWQLGIHMADVAHYVPDDGPIDREARKRGTAADLGELVLPMLPEAVLQQSSLQPETDRLAVSALLTLNETGRLVSFELAPSVVRVDRQLSFAQAQSLLGQGESGNADRAAAIQMLDRLFFTVSPLVKAQRLQRGGFELELGDDRSLFKDEGRLGAIATSSALPVRALLREVVVLAGRAVAAHLQALSLPGVYRAQSAPPPGELNDLIRLGNNLGLALSLSDPETVQPKDYQAFTHQFSQSPSPQVLAHLLRSTLKPVRASATPEFYFGLAEDEGYAPCTAPGKRYGDLLVQRALKTLFEFGRDRRHRRAKEGYDLGKSANHDSINWNVLPARVHSDLEARLHGAIGPIGERERTIADAEADLVGLQKAAQMKARTGEVFVGPITGVQSYGFFVEIEALLVEGLVHVSSLKDDWYEYRARHACLVGRKTRTTYKLGARVQVQVKSVDYYRQQIDLIAVGGAEATDAEASERDGAQASVQASEA